MPAEPRIRNEGQALPGSSVDRNESEWGQDSTGAAKQRLPPTGAPSGPTRDPRLDAGGLYTVSADDAEAVALLP